MKMALALLLGLADTATPRMPSGQPIVHPQTTAAIVLHESGGDPLLIHDNTTGQSVSFPDALSAHTALRSLLAAGDSVDVGLMQINYANFGKYGLTTETIFSEVANIRAGTKLAYDNYQTCLNREAGPSALDCMLSYYNTGNPQHGLVNGYVRKVRVQAGEIARAVPALVDTPPVPQSAPHDMDGAIHIFTMGNYK